MHYVPSSPEYPSSSPEPRRSASLVVSLVLCGVVLWGCGDSAGSGGNDSAVTADASAMDGSTQSDAEILPPTALLEIYALDLWAQPVPESEATLVVTRDGAPVTTSGWPVALVELRESGDYRLELSAPEHETLEVTVSWNGGTALDDAVLALDATETGAGFGASHELRTVGGNELPVHSVYLGLRHLWFSAQGRPARRGNDIELLMDGEQAWSAVYDELNLATDTIMVTSWWWDSEFELIRDATDHHLLTPTERWDNTILGVLQASPATRRVLVGEFWGSHSILDWITSDSELMSYAETPGDHFEVMGQGNYTSGEFWFEPATFRFLDRVEQTHAETAGRTFDATRDIDSTVPARMVDLTDLPGGLSVQLASHHQKFMVLDQELAFVGGMNFNISDWDSSDHRVFDQRRMEFDASQSDREDVIAKTERPDIVPRKDYMMRIVGPAVQDVADVFHTRWSHNISEGAQYAEHATDFVVARDQAPEPGGLQIQITTTLPEPFWEHSIAATWFNAVAQAQDYIFVEDQYWRLPMVVDAIIQRMQQVPTLRLLVVTQPVNETTDPACAWTHTTHQQLLAAFPNRYATYQLQTFDYVIADRLAWNERETEARYDNISVHSKMLIVDDKFMSVGSCNKNNRGLVFEGEMNVAVLDPVWVRQQRRRIFANILPASAPATDDVATWWTQFQQAADYNDIVYESWDAEGFDIDLGDDANPDPLPLSWQPEGFLRTLEFRTLNDCLIENIGPDIF